MTPFPAFKADMIDPEAPWLITMSDSATFASNASGSRKRSKGKLSGS